MKNVFLYNECHLMSETVFGGIHVFLLKVSQLRCLFLGQCPCMLSLLSFRMMVSSSTANSRFFPPFAGGETLYFLYSAAFFVSSGSLSKRCERQNESFSPQKKDRPTSSSHYHVSFFRESVFGTPFFRQIFASELQF